MPADPDRSGAHSTRACRPARIDAPPAGDWSGFMRRLDQACRTESAPVEAMSADRFRLNTASRAWSGSSRRSWVRKAVVTAASLALIGLAGFIEERLRLASPAPRVTSVPAAASGQAAPEADRSAARAVAELSEQHFERSKLVVLGLVARDPDHTSAKDWEYERDLAGSLLEDTRLYRRAAQDEGLRTSRTSCRTWRPCCWRRR